MTKNKKNQTSLSPIVTIIILILLVAASSSILSILNVDSNKTSIINGDLETSIVVIRNVFSKDGIINFFSNVITNFSLIGMLPLIILSFGAVSIGKNSGFLKHLFLPLKKINFSFLTFLVVLISFFSTAIGEYSYVLLLPLIAVMYEFLDKNSMLGILTVFLGITLGYGTGFAYSYDNYSLGLLTQLAASLNVDTTYKYTLTSNLYIMLSSSIFIAYVLTFLINKYLVKRVGITEVMDDEKIVSKKALLTSLLVIFIGIVMVLIVAVPRFGGILLNNGEERYIAKLFGFSSPFNEAFVFVYFIILALASTVYGFISKNFKNTHDLGNSLTNEFNNTGYLFILLFLYSILIGLINWTNIGSFVTNKLITLLSVLGFSGIPLIITSFIFVVIMSILLPNSLEKWSLLSPLIIPLFMRANITPDFTQFIFMVADGIGKSITPVFIYFILTLSLIIKYNKKEKQYGLFSMFKLYFPIILTIALLWIIILVVWYLSGIPIGISTYATM